MSDAIRPFVFALRDAMADLQLDAIPPVEREILLVIATYCSPAGRDAFPSIAELRRVTGRSVSRIVEAIQALRAHRWLTCHERRLQNGARTSTSYDLQLTGEPWPASEGRAKRKSAFRLQPGGGPPLRATESPPPLRPTESPLPSDARPPFRPTQGPLPSDGKDQPMISPSDQPMINPIFCAHDRAEDDRPRATSIPFGPSPSPETTPIPTSTVREIVPAQPALPGFELLPEPPPPPAPPKPPTKAELEQAVFDAWTEERAKHVRKGGVPVLDSKRRTLVHARMRDGFPLEDLIAAVRGIWREPWFCENHRTDFDLALRNAANVERFRPLGQPPPPPEPAPEPFRPKRIPLPTPEEIDRRRDEAAAREVERNARLRNPEIEAALRPALERAAARMAAANG